MWKIKVQFYYNLENEGVEITGVEEVKNLKNNKELIDQAFIYIEENNTLVDLKEYCNWKKQEIVKGLFKVKTDFSCDRGIEFVDGRKAIIWL